jgi:hypothetical protein
VCAGDRAGYRSLAALAAGRIVGVAEFERTEPHPSVAEMAVGVAEGWHGRGVGTLLLEHLVHAARGDGIGAFVADALADNHLMLKVFADLGLPVSRRFAGSEVHCAVRLDVGDERYLRAVDERARQRTDHELLDPDNATLGHRDVMRWNTPDDWIISAKPAHPALVSEADFVTAQHLHAAHQTAAHRVYLLAGLLRCGVYERLMESCWTHGRPAYRCRHGHTSATRPDPDRPPNAYVREDQVLLHLLALVIRLSAEDGHLPPPTATRAVMPADAVAHVRAEQVSLTFDPAAQTLTADTQRGERPGHSAGMSNTRVRPGAGGGCRFRLPTNRAPWGKSVSEGGLEPPRP